MACGSLVIIQGLKSEAGQQLEGRLGEVRDVDAVTGRLCLRLNPADPPAKWKKIKLENARPLPMAEVPPDASEDVGEARVAGTGSCQEEAAAGCMKR